MSRIEDALKRAGVAGPRPVPAPDAKTPHPGVDPLAEEEAVVDPWNFSEGDERPRTREVAAQPGVARPMPVPNIDAAADAFTPTISSEKVVPNVSSAAPVEQYRRLAATLHHAQADRGVRVIMVTSALPREGKTLTTINLALTMSESYKRRVLLVDADLRRPSVHDAFGVPNVAGLTDGLAAGDETRLSVLQMSPTLSLLTSGRPVVDPMHLLSSARMKKIVSEAAENFDWVIIDTPPVALLSDANILAAMVDGAVLVLQAGETPYEAAQKAIEAIGRDRIVGVVLNGVDDATAHQHYDSYAYRYGGYGSPRDRR